MRTRSPLDQVRRVHPLDAGRASRSTAVSPFAPPSRAGLLSLQAMAGNAAVKSLLRSMDRQTKVQRSCCTSCASGKRCEGDQTADEDRGSSTELQRTALVLQRRQTTGLLSKGSRGDKVRRSQEQLNGLGAAPELDADGSFGAKTDVAVRAFQQAHNLKPDGIIGEFTATMLGNEHALHADSSGRQPCHTPDDPGPDTAFDRPLEDPAPVRLALNDGVTAPVGVGPNGERVIVRLTNETGEKRKSDDAELAAFGGTVEQAFTVEALIAVLAKHPNISTLGLLSHGTPQGKIFIGGTEIGLAELAGRLAQRSGGTIGSIVFLGCSVGNDKPGLGSIKQKLGAKNSEGASCNVSTRVATPVVDGNRRPLTSVAAIRRTGSPNAAEAIRNNAKAQLGKPQRTGCILGFSPADTIDSVPDDKLFSAYDQHKGVLAAKFTSDPSCETCYEMLKFDEPDPCGCKRVQA